MALESVHPSYTDMRPEWDKTRDCYKGERWVKAQGAKYLPPTKGMRLDGYGLATAANTVNVGQEAYDAYKLRAVFPDYFKDAVDTFVGLLHSKPAVFELPPQLEYLVDKATIKGETLQLLLRRIHTEQLTTGRLGLMLDLPTNPDPANPQPRFALYATEAVVNWDDGSIGEGDVKLNFVQLDESGFQRQGFQWTYKTKYRVLELDGSLGGIDGVEGTEVVFGNYRQGVFETDGQGQPTFVASDMLVPMLRGQPLAEIPFVFINPSDLTSEPDEPPMAGLANICMTIYRGEADYRQSLFLQGQDTLVIIGELKADRKTDVNELTPTRGNVLNTEEPLRTGTGSMIQLEADPGAKAEYIGVNSSGLTEQREALTADRQRAESKAGALSHDTNDVQSGEALKTKVSARTASLNQIARTGAAGVEYLLKVAARWMGADEKAVKVTPNLEFADVQMTGQNLAALMGAKTAGAPLSRETIHDLIVEGKLTTKTWEEEKALLDQEAAEMPPPGTNAGGAPVPPGGPQNQPPQNQPPKGPPNAPPKKRPGA